MILNYIQKINFSKDKESIISYCIENIKEGNRNNDETKRKNSSTSTNSTSSEESQNMKPINSGMNNSSYINPKLENTEILRVKVKISKDNLAEFKLKRYDDVFETIKLFCEINGVKEELIKPLIMKSLSAMNTIYQVMNTKISDEEDIELLKKLKNAEKKVD